MINGSGRVGDYSTAVRFTYSWGSNEGSPIQARRGRLEDSSEQEGLTQPRRGCGPVRRSAWPRYGGGAGTLSGQSSSDSQAYKYA